MAEIAGLKLIVPSSVAGSGVSVSASGKVTFTAATSISVNGVFSATYDNYLVVIRHVGNSGAPEFSARLRLSGTDASGSDYVFQQLVANGSTVAGARITSATRLRLGDTAATQRSGTHLYLYGPALAQPTATRTVNVVGDSSALIFDVASTHALSTAYDGLTVYPSSGDITGALCVYGLSQ